MTASSMASTTDSDTNDSNKQRKKLQCSRALILFVLTLSGLAVGGTTYGLLRSGETANFEAAVNGFAMDINKRVNLQGELLLENAANLASTITAFAVNTKATWPFVQVQDFAIRSGAHTHALFAPIVTQSQRDAWQAYTAATASYNQDDETQNAFNHDAATTRISPEIYRFAGGDGGAAVPQGVPSIAGTDAYAPVWQQAPLQNTAIINFDLLSHPIFNRVFRGMLQLGRPVLSEMMQLEWLSHDASSSDNDKVREEGEGTLLSPPQSFLLQPILPSLHHNPTTNMESLVGLLTLVVRWDAFLSDILHPDVKGMMVVLHNSCSDYLTFRLDGPDAVFVGEGDLHDAKYDNLWVETPQVPFLESISTLLNTRHHCQYQLRVYPSKSVEANYRTHEPVLYGAVLFFVFLLVVISIYLYDSSSSSVARNDGNSTTDVTHGKAVAFPNEAQNKEKSTPKNERLALRRIDRDRTQRRLSMLGAAGFKEQLKDFLDQEDEKQKSFLASQDRGSQSDGATAFENKPIADFFPQVSLLCADIAGFTAWSSVREPSQVFTLLETVYATFDEIARKRRVFKVETVGDCYVAVVGLPDPRPDHAIVMARFAADCVRQMDTLTKRLEVKLGPDTGELSIRAGLHSGPVTAGVLRGEKSRFQLFGDTMNLASRIESTGSPNRIHVSSDTASLLQEAGKVHWLKEREDKIEAKGKGKITTYWLEMETTIADESTRKLQLRGVSDSRLTTRDEKGQDDRDPIEMPPHLTEKEARLVNWNVDVVLRLLREIAVRREAYERHKLDSKDDGANESLDDDFDDIPILLERQEMTAPRAEGTVLDEVQGIVTLPQFDAVAEKYLRDPDYVVLSEDVVEQVREFVKTIASLYRHNPFHNFDHASHVTMSQVKLMARIVSPEYSSDDNDVEKRLHDHTYGITSDPLTRFACIFSALIHDVDHMGVPNTQLIIENKTLAQVYQNRSIAEQNSVDLAWDLLMEDQFKAFRRAIYCNISEFQRFRQLVVNSVMATDIMDQGLKAIRNGRWDKAFHPEEDEEELVQENINRKATIVIEHLIQASDVSHTMQHWHIYVRWNERLFMEMYKAYQEGRAEKDPTENWYRGEIGFFDFYIIPLAKKLKACGVFGVSSDEYLNYATNNRREWELRGQEVVNSYMDKLRKLEEASTNGKQECV